MRVRRRKRQERGQRMRKSEEETREEKVGGIYALLQAAVCM